MPSIDRLRLFAAVVFIGSTVVLAFQLINPSPVVVSVGDQGTEVAQLHNHFRYRDVSILVVAACLLGASGMYILVADAGPTTDASDSSTPNNTQQAQECGASTQSVETPEADGVEPSAELLDARRNEWEETAKRLADNEADIYETVLEADGVLPQNDIVEQTDLSKATVSRTLDSLEVKNLVERKRRGMGNIVLLV